jgi:hypothetical protein
LVGDSFSSELAEITPARIQSWVNEILSGEGRSVSEIRTDILDIIVGAPLIQRVFGVTAERAENLISGTETFAGQDLTPSTRDPLFNPSITGSAGISIPAGLTLYRVVDPRSGTTTYHAVGEAYGVRISWEIGDQAALDELGISDAFDATIRTTVDKFSTLNALALGSVDEILNQTEPLGVQLERQLQTFSKEGVPSWMRDDPKAMFIAMQAANEGWSQSRTLKALASTEGFKTRFTAWSTALEQGGGDEAAAMAWYTQTESQIKQLVIRFRGPDADTSAASLGQIMTYGWTPDSIAPILEAEADLRLNPSALDDLNRMLVAAGRKSIGRSGMIAMIAAGKLPKKEAQTFLADLDLTKLLAGNDVASTFDLINDALLADSLSEAGLTGFDLDFVRNLRDETGGIVDEASLSSFAQTAAANVLRFSRDIDFSRYGLSEEDVVATAAGRPSPTGRTAAQNADIMSKILREREAAGRGLGSPNTFFNREGRLVIQGLGGL